MPKDSKKKYLINVSEMVDNLNCLAVTIILFAVAFWIITEGLLNISKFDF